jgi:hypothetical protein
MDGGSLAVGDVRSVAVEVLRRERPRRRAVCGRRIRDERDGGQGGDERRAADV